MVNFSSEITFQTSRSGGKGGQNVNKVETAVIGYFAVDDSSLLTTHQKEVIKQKLAGKINKEGFLLVKSQTHREQLSNKAEAIEKINELIHTALKKKIARIATKPSKQSKEKRLEWKKRQSDAKSGRRKWREGE